MYRFKAIREQNKLTQDKVAAMLGISRASYTNIENGKRDPDTDSLITLASIFHTTVDYLLGITDEALSPGMALGAKEKELLDIFAQLNDEGQSLLIDQAISILNRNSMRKDGPMSSMA